jgi:hypothetical protein
MALNPIDSAPKNEGFIILQDESSVVYEVARWSVEKGNWIREEGEPIQITPTHWMPLPGAFVAPSSDESNGGDEEASRRIPRVGLYAGICVTAGLAILFVPSFVGNFARPTSTGEISSEGKQIIEQGPQKGEVPSRDVALARAEIENLKMRTAAQSAVPTETYQLPPTWVPGHEEAIERERQRGEVLARELVSAREEVEAVAARLAVATAARFDAEQALQTAQAWAAEQKQALERERRHNEALTRDLTSARDEVELRRAAERAAADAEKKAQAVASEHQDALEQERQRSGTLFRELASAREEVKSLTTRIAAVSAARSETEQTLEITQASVAEQVRAIEQERKRGDAFARDLASIGAEVEARKTAERVAADAVQEARMAASKQQDALEKERERGDAFARDLLSVREEVEVLKARVAAATAEHIEAAQSLEAARASAAQERQRGDALVRDLAMARAEVDGLKARLAAAIVASIESPQSVQGAHALPQESPQQPPVPSTQVIASERLAAPAGHASAVDTRRIADTKPSLGTGQNVITPIHEPQVAAVGERTRAAAPPPEPIEELIALWVKRGEDFVAVGDFASARMLFQRAADAGDGQAALMLGATYDPNVLHRFGAKGLTADIAEARLWYEKARALGSPEAPRRLEALAQPRR